MKGYVAIDNVHAGHNPDGKNASGAVGLFKESTEARKVVKYLKKYLKKAGHKVYNCTCNNGKDQRDVLEKIVKKCNKHKVDADYSIHFNCCVSDYKGDGKTTGTECHVYKKENNQINKIADNITKEIEKLGFRNRGVYATPSLYVLNSTNAPAALIECCFCDDKDDANLYDAKKMAKAIAHGIINSYTYTVKTTKKGVYLRKKAAKDIKVAGNLGRLPKKSVCVISKHKIKDGIVFGYVKKYNAWISLENVKLV